MLIIDGVFAFRSQINDYWDLRVWLAVAEDLSLRRGTARDQSWSGAKAEALHRERYLAAERLTLPKSIQSPRRTLSSTTRPSTAP